MDTVSMIQLMTVVFVSDVRGGNVAVRSNHRAIEKA